jgi:hypothetical protein
MGVPTADGGKISTDWGADGRFSDGTESSLGVEGGVYQCSKGVAGEEGAVWNWRPGVPGDLSVGREKEEKTGGGGNAIEDGPMDLVAESRGVCIVQRKASAQVESKRENKIKFFLFNSTISESTQLEQTNSIPSRQNTLYQRPISILYIYISLSLLHPSLGDNRPNNFYSDLPIPPSEPPSNAPTPHERHTDNDVRQAETLMTYSQISSHNFVQILCEQADVMCVEPRHRDAPIASHVDMRLLNHGLALVGIQPSEAVAKDQQPLTCAKPRSSHLNMPIWFRM